MTINAHTPAWSRQVQPCANLHSFLYAWRCGYFDDHAGEPPTTALGLDGSDPHPLLAAPGNFRESTMISGEIRDGRGYHPAATFVDCAIGRATRAA